MILLEGGGGACEIDVVEVGWVGNRGVKGITYTARSHFAANEMKRRRSNVKDRAGVSSLFWPHAIGRDVQVNQITLFRLLLGSVRSSELRSAFTLKIRML